MLADHLRRIREGERLFKSAVKTIDKLVKDWAAKLGIEARKGEDGGALRQVSVRHLLQNQLVGELDPETTRLRAYVLIRTLRLSAGIAHLDAAHRETLNDRLRQFRRTVDEGIDGVNDVLVMASGGGSEESPESRAAFTKLLDDVETRRRSRVESSQEVLGELRAILEKIVSEANGFSTAMRHGVAVRMLESVDPEGFRNTTFQFIRNTRIAARFAGLCTTQMATLDERLMVLRVLEDRLTDEGNGLFIHFAAGKTFPPPSVHTPADPGRWR
jgi:hypothetical protein